MEDLNQSLEQGKTPKYIKINNAKILTPNDIKRLDVYENEYNIFGDPRIKNVVFDEDKLKEIQDRYAFIVVLKQTKGNVYAFPVALSKIMEQRKFRLSNLINLEKISEAQGETNYQTAVDYIKEKIEITQPLSDEEIYDEFLSSMDDDLVCMDIKRIIQLYHQS